MKENQYLEAQGKSLLQTTPEIKSLSSRPLCATQPLGLRHKYKWVL